MRRSMLIARGVLSSLMPAVALTALALLSVALPSVARALPMDPALARLTVGAGCLAGSGAGSCLPDRAAYHKLVSQWGFALAPHSVHGARTTGLSGFDVSLLAAFTGIDASADYWRRGTQGKSELAVGGAVPLNTDPDALLQLYSLEVRKGFGFGIEAAASVGVMPNASLIAWGGDVRVALIEGMRHGALRYFPDTSLGVGVRQATGMGELALGSFAIDGRLSRPIVGAAGFVITPWLGYQWLRIHADSTLVDLSPGVDALAQCGYAGANLPGAPAGSAATGAPSGVFDGSSICQSGTGSDLANSVSFGQADVTRQRVLVGLGYRQELLKLGAELMTDLLRPDAAQSDDDVADALRCDDTGESCRPTPRQWTLVLQLGAAF